MLSARYYYHLTNDASFIAIAELKLEHHCRRSVNESFITGRVKLDYRRPLDIMAIDQITKKE